MATTDTEKMTEAVEEAEVVTEVVEGEAVIDMTEIGTDRKEKRHSSLWISWMVPSEVQRLVKVCLT